MKTVAQMFRKWCYDYRDQLTAGIICAGWDKYEGGQVFSIPLGGMSIRQPFAIGGEYNYTLHCVPPSTMSTMIVCIFLH